MASNEWLVRKLHEQDKKIEALSRGGTGVGHTSIAPGENLTVISDNGEVVLGAGGVEHVDGPTPATPSAPTLKLGFGTIETTWDGTFAEGEDEDGVPLTPPVDFDVVEVHCSTDPEEEEWGDDTRRGQIKTREGGTVTVGGFDVDDEVFVCLIALAKTGKRSAPSATASLVIEGLDFSQLFNELDAANATIKNAGEILVTEQDTLNDKLDDAFGQIEDAIVSANGKNVVHYEDAPPTESDPGVEGDTWFVVDLQKIPNPNNLALNGAYNTLQYQRGGGSATPTAGTSIALSTEWFSSEPTSLKITPDGSVNTTAVDQMQRDDTASADDAGKTFTIAADFHQNEPQTGTTWANRRRITVRTRTGSSTSNNFANSDSAENVAGTQRLKVTFTIPDGIHSWYFMLTNGSSTTPCWWDNVTIEEGATQGRYWENGDGTWNVLEQYQHNGSAWEPVQLSHSVISSMDVGKLVAGSAAIKEAVVQKLFAEVVVSRMSVADEFIGENAILTGAVTAPKITASEELWAKIGEFVTIRSEQIAADAIDGMVITGGTYRTSGGNGSWSDAGLFIAQPDGTSMVRFPTDGSPLSLTASDTQIERASVGELDVADGAVRSGGQVTLASGVTAPASPPELTTGWQKVASLQTPDSALTYDWLGLGYWAEGDGHWVRAVNVLGSEGDGYDRIEVYDYATGDFQKSISITLNPRAGVTVIGDVAYVLGPNHEVNSFSPQYVDGYNLHTGEKVSWFGYTRFATNAGGKLAIGNDGTNVVVAGITKSNNLYVMRYDPTTGAQVGGEPNPPSDPLGGDWMATGWTGGRDLLGVSISGSEVTIHPPQETRVYTASGNTLTRKLDAANANGFAGWVNPDRNGAGLVMRGAPPEVVDGAGDVYRGTIYASDIQVQVCFTWRDGTNETTPSPTASITLPARTTLQVSMPVRAGTQKRVYLNAGSGWVWSDVDENVTAWSFPASIGGFSDPPTANSFPAATPAVLKSNIGGFEVKGDGSGSWGPLTFGADGSMTGIPKMAAGTVTITVTNQTDGFKTETVQFPVGRFTTPPAVTVSGNSTAPVLINVGVLSVTAEQATISVRRTTSTPTVVSWIAMEVA